MALSFDPRLNPSGSRSGRAGKQKSGRGTAPSRGGSSRRGSASGRGSRSAGSRRPASGGSAPRSSARGSRRSASRYSGSSRNGRSQRSGRGAGGSRRSASRGSASSSRPIKGKRTSVGVKAKADNTKQARDREKAEKAERKEEKRRRKEEGALAKARAKRSSVTGSMPKTSSRAGRDATDGETSGERSARRVGDIRAAEREKRNRSRYRRYILRIAAIVGAVLVVVFGSIFVYRSDLFHVNNVHVNGVSHLTSQEITNIAAVPSDSTLIRLDSDAIVERLKSNAWVQDATVSRELPDTIVIDVTERQPAAVVRLNNKATWVVSSDGTWLSAATSDDWKKGPRIIDVSKSLSQPVSGSDCNDGGIKNALAIIAGISDSLKSQVKSISAESSIKTSLNLDDGVTVAFGDSSDIQMKEAAIEALLEQYSGKISYINVRVPTRPTYRTLTE